MITIPLTTPRVITPQVDIETLAKYVDERVHTVQDLLSEHPQIADKVLRYRTGEPLNPQEAKAAIDAAERYANEAYAQNHQLKNIFRRDLLGGAFLGAFVHSVGSNTGTQATSTAKANYLPRREFLRRASLFGAALGAGYSNIAGSAALSRGAQLINPIRATILLTALAAGVSQTACTAVMVEGSKLGKDMSLEERLHQYLKYVDSAIKAGTWDKVYGPSLAFWKGIPQDFEGHKAKVRQIGEFIGRTPEQAGSIDYDVFPGTPVVAIHPSYCHFKGDDRLGGLFVSVTYTLRNNGSYSHLSEILINKGQRAMRGTIIGLSGTTETSYPHLDLALYERRGNVSPLVDPFKYGESGGRPKFLVDKDVDKGYVGIRDIFDLFVELYVGSDKQAFAKKMLEEFIERGEQKTSYLREFMSKNPALFESKNVLFGRRANVEFWYKNSEFIAQNLRYITLPFPNPDIVKEDLSLPPEKRFYHLPNAVNKF